MITLAVLLFLLLIIRIIHVCEVRELLCKSIRPRNYIIKNYCRFGNFRENFIFANSIKRHIINVKKSPLRQGLPIYINKRHSDFAISQGFNFHETSHM